MAEPPAVELMPDQWAHVLAALKHTREEFSRMPYSGPQTTAAALKDISGNICEQLGISAAYDG